MKSNVKKYFPLLFLCPLLMANSPIPMPAIDAYRKLVGNNVSYEYLDKALDYRHLYTLDMSNTGDYYAESDQFYIDDASSYLLALPSDSLFENQLIAPHTSMHMYLYSSNKIDSIVDNMIFEGRAYTNIDESVTFSDVTFKNKNLYNDEFAVSISYKVDGLGDYYYNLIVEIEYEENTYFINLGRNNYINCDDSVDASKIVFKKMVVATSKGGTYNPGPSILNIGMGFLGVIGVFSLIVAIVVPGIVAISVVSSVKRKRRNRNKQANE